MRTVVSGLFLLIIIFPAFSSAQTFPTATQESHEFSLIQTGRGLTFHKEMGVLPFTYADKYNGGETEVVFQLSAKHDIAGTRFYTAYTQVSFWQAYDSGNSAPFRDTNYNPEIFYRFPETTLGFGSLGADAGFEHESNGQRVPLSRSWNLLYLAPSFHGDNWLAYFKLRYRIPEDDKETPDSAVGDDNPDITDYLGYSDINFYYMLPKGNLLHFLMRGYLGTDKGNVSLNLSFPAPHSESGFLVLRFFSGYGESLMDYNCSITRVGIGFLYNR
ncbi:MAG: phospholipase A [Gemmatimonadales bacterium]|nr:phospholipase A [Gemmatimonadales bacterium]